LFVVRPAPEISKRPRVNPKIVDCNCNVIYSTTPQPYEFHSQNAHHAFCNHANDRLGGGLFDPETSYFQEEKITLTLSLLFLLAQKNIGNPGNLENLEILNTKLRFQPLVIKTNVLFHEDAPYKLYGHPGLKIISDGPGILADVYTLHESAPRIYWICKSIPKIRRGWGENYSKVINDQPIMLWALLLAVESYLLAIKCMETDNKIKEIHIHECNYEDNWRCGTFGHNLNTIYVIVHLAISIAVDLARPTKKVYFDYCTYDESNFKKLEQGIFYWKNACEHKLTPEQILSDLKQLQTTDPDHWERKL